MPNHTPNPHSKAAKIPPISSAKNSDGTWNALQFKAVSDQMFADEQAGHLKMDHAMFEEADGKRYFMCVMTPT